MNDLRLKLISILDGHTEFSRDCHLSGEYLVGLIWPTVEAALAEKMRQRQWDGPLTVDL